MLKSAYRLPRNHGVGWICTPQTDRLVPALTSAPGPCDPGIQEGQDPAPFGFGLVRSANGHFIEGVGPQGERTIYRAALRSWTSGLTLAAVSDSGSRVVRSDGMLLDGSDNLLGNLASIVPFTPVPGGYGLSSGGRFGFVYGYRQVGTTTQSATDATLWVVDLNDAATAGVGAAPVIATIALPQAVGCTAALVAGETCQHTASIGVAPGDGTAFVLGPRGVAAVPLPAAVSSAAPMSSAQNRAKAASQAPKKVQAPLRGVLRPAQVSK